MRRIPLVLVACVLVLSSAVRVPASTLEEHFRTRLFRDRDHQALDLLQRTLIDEALGGLADTKKVLLVPQGWGNYSSPHEHVVVGSLTRVEFELDRIKEGPDYDWFFHGMYARQALDTVYPGCFTHVEIAPPHRLPDNRLRVIYKLPRFGSHPIGPGEFLLKWRISGWKVLSHEPGKVSFGILTP